MNKMKKIILFTGIRSEYEHIKGIAHALEKDDHFQLSLVVSGAHLSPLHNTSYNQIIKDGFNICEHVDSLLYTQRDTQRIKAVGMLCLAYSQTIEREKPDFLVTVGDREESIAVALAGAYMGVLVVHIAGGETCFGNVDDNIRFAVSELAHIHFTTTEKYSGILHRLGEEKFRIFCCGNPALDNIKRIKTISIKKISENIKYTITEKKYIILLYHPLSSELEKTQQEISSTLGILKEFCINNHLKTICIYPNSDPGSEVIINEYEIFLHDDWISTFNNINTKIFVNLLRNCLLLIGNSSMGILEAPFYNIPVINIGKRQKGRLNAGNVKFIYDINNSLEEALHTASYNEKYRENIKNMISPYGNGDSGPIISKVLKSIDPDDKKWLTKYKNKNYFSK